MRRSLAGFWRWLRNAGNRTVLGWLGGGLVVLAGGLWIAFTHLTASPAPFLRSSWPEPSRRDVKESETLLRRAVRRRRLYSSSE